ncbi:phosphoglycerate dehydrogenase [Desulfuribacillus stibiiarsenatis]|uniref:D-3-phosphoglycerate dehydrogenase n=1 Tax=Desulfuribacillus stibiiarsenatis TaxID=1390249 RepID=A0A1E5L6F9_9FIRM|nr:phosphoglycerate dehydrogenase [Desulfuribacillus stibiiarsenatis]OEH85725.1 phosphoglycerate dehydrogenase [Desulfuribacillus stibiiarsenatis]
MFKVLVSDPISDVGLKSLIEDPMVDLTIQTGLEKEQLLNIIGNFDALLVRSQTKVTAEVINAGKNLKVIGRAGVGVDNIDLDAATDRGILVINAPDGNTISTAEHAFAMLISMARNIPQAHGKLKHGVWDRKNFTGVELNKKVLGVVGVGRIGAEVAKRAKAFNMDILGFDPFMSQERAEQLGITLASVEQIFEKADFVTFHTPLTKETKYMLDKPQFAKMKKGVRIVNCARGGIVNEEALYDAIKEGIVAGAALDVFEEEPAVGNPLLELPQLVATPHLGASTEEAQLNVAIDVAEEVANVLHGKGFKNAVNLAILPEEDFAELKPYLKLGQKLGSLAAQISTGRIEKLEITYAGNIADLKCEPLSRYIIRGLLSYHLADDVNYINAYKAAKSKHVEIVESKTHTSKGFANLVSISVKTANEYIQVAGSLLNGYGAKIVNINGYTVDANPVGNLLLAQHTDKPGIIGIVGTMLGEADINIATMQVGRKVAGGDAVMVLGVDKRIPEDVVKKLEAVSGINSIFNVDLQN